MFFALFTNIFHLKLFFFLVATGTKHVATSCNCNCFSFTLIITTDSLTKFNEFVGYGNRLAAKIGTRENDYQQKMVINMSTRNALLRTYDWAYFSLAAVKVKMWNNLNKCFFVVVVVVWPIECCFFDRNAKIISFESFFNHFLMHTIKKKETQSTHIDWKPMEFS